MKLTLEQYQNLIAAHEKGEYANIICNTSCGLGKEKTFEVKNSTKKVVMKCTQRGGMFTGSHCFIFVRSI